MAAVRLRAALREAVARLPNYWTGPCQGGGGGGSMWNKQQQVLKAPLPSPLSEPGAAFGVFFRQPGEGGGAVAEPTRDSPLLWCGRGDKKTKRGKRFKGSFGNARPTKGTVARRLRQRWQIPPGEPLPVKLQ